MLSISSKTDIMADLEAGESTPLVPKNEEETTLGTLGTDAETQLSATQKIKEKIVHGAAAITASTSVASMFLYPDPLVLISGSIGAAVAPLASMQENKLIDLQMMKELNEKMEKQVETLHEQNNALEKQIIVVEETVLELEEMQAALEVIKKSEIETVSCMEQQLSQSKEILAKMRKNRKAIVLQNIVGILIASDIDNDSIIDDEEIDSLFLKFKEVELIKVNEEKFRKIIIDNGRSLNAVMKVIRNLMSDDVSDGDQVISFLTEADIEKQTSF